MFLFLDCHFSVFAFLVAVYSSNPSGQLKVSTQNNNVGQSDQKFVRTKPTIQIPNVPHDILFINRNVAFIR